MTRQLRHKFFLGSTIEEINKDLNDWLRINAICPGNLVESVLYKHGSVYQFSVWYATLVIEGSIQPI
jgi:hypothetical protein